MKISGDTLFAVPNGLRRTFFGLSANASSLPATVCDLAVTRDNLRMKNENLPVLSDDLLVKFLWQ
jgi:hypothetical protein